MERSSGNRSSISYIIPLLPYEKSLILEVGRLLDSGKVSHLDLGGPCSPVDAFKTWRWYKMFSGWLLSDLDFESVASHGGDRELAYDRCLQVLMNLDADGKNLFRINATRSSNASFLQELGDSPCDNMTFRWSESDEDSWEVVSKIINAFGQPWKHPDILNEKYEHFEIWELIRVFFIHAQNPENADLIEQHLIQHPIFEALFDVLRSSQSKSHFTQLRIYRHVHPAELPQARSFGDGTEFTDDQMKSLFSWVSRQQRFQDPRAYLRFLPWDTLEPISQDTLRNLGIDLSLLLKHETGIDQWVVWKPQLPGYAANHHLFVEEELFSYSIDKSWPLPGHYLGERVIFGVESLYDCGLVPDLAYFWTRYNDCALTKRDDGEVCVLQTIPGIHLRLRTAELDYKAALGYYRSITEAHASERPSGESVKELLGLGSGYNALYEDTLRLIPGSGWTIRDINWKAPLAKSSRSAVYAATLSRQQTVLSTSQSGDLMVVLKDVIPQGSREVTEKFIKELDATWFALGGKARNCVKFFGLAKVEFGDSHRLMLVSERATQGNIMEFLEREFKKDLQYRERWGILGSALSGIAHGLGWVHGHKVVHRDLHPGNIFVTDREYRLDPNMPHEYGYILGDLGEGKKLGPSVAGQGNPHASYGAVDYRAPEQFASGFDHNNLSAAMAAEVFSFGKLACKLLEWRANCAPPREHIPDEILKDARSSRSPEDLSEELGYLVPTVIRDTIGLCLSQLPVMRPSMKEVGQSLEDLWCGLEGDASSDREGDFEVRWCFWNWENTGVPSTASPHGNGEESSVTIDLYDI